jgi:hypothetical protein
MTIGLDQTPNSMKNIILVMLSILSFSTSPVIADDISSYQIEGISIGESLLDYMSEDKILSEIERTKEWYPHLKEPYKYANVYLGGKFNNFDYLGFVIENNQTNQYVSNKDEKYIIQSILGNKDYIENFDACINKRDDIANLFSKSFPNTQKSEELLKHGVDPSGKSIIDAVYFNFDSGASIEASCSNLDEDFRRQIKWSEGLTIVIHPKHIIDWLKDHK